MKKVYLAGPWACKTAMKAIADVLRSNQIVLTSRWHDSDYDSAVYEGSPHTMETECQKDWNDINEADTLVYMNLVKSEGKATELGIALAKGLPIYVVGGKQNNVFLHLPWINHRDSLTDVVQEITSGS